MIVLAYMMLFALQLLESTMASTHTHPNYQLLSFLLNNVSHWSWPDGYAYIYTL